MAVALMVSAYFPDHSAKGSAARLAAVVEHLDERGVEVHLLHVSRRGAHFQASPVVRRRIRSVTPFYLKARQLDGIVPQPVRAATRPARSLVMRGLNRWAQRMNPLPSVKQEILSVIDRVRPNVVWVDHTDLAALTAEVQPVVDALWVVDTHDVLHLRDESRRQAGLPAQSEISRAEETALLRPFDLVIAIQNEERRVLSAMLPGRRVVTLEHTLDIDPQPATRPALCFVGSKIDVNLQGLLAFIDEAWPAIRTRCPRATLEIVGGICQAAEVRRAAAARDSRLVLRGVVPRVADIYHGPAAIICPLWAGSGLKIKMVEALAHGKATVATAVAAQGLAEGIDRAFLLAESPRDFIEPVTRLLNDSAWRQDLEAAALQFARQRFAPARVWRELDAILDSALGRRQWRAAA